MLPGPLTDVRKLPKVQVETKLGKLNCAVVSGQTQAIFKRMGRDIHCTFETQLHKQAPFGVVAMRLMVEVKEGDRVQEKVTQSFKLADAGKNAKSELPDQTQSAK